MLLPSLQIYWISNKQFSFWSKVQLKKRYFFRRAIYVSTNKRGHLKKNLSPRFIVSKSSYADLRHPFLQCLGNRPALLDVNKVRPIPLKCEQFAHYSCHLTYFHAPIYTEKKTNKFSRDFQVKTETLEIKGFVLNSWRRNSLLRLKITWIIWGKSLTDLKGTIRFLYTHICLLYSKCQYSKTDVEKIQRESWKIQKCLL